VKGKIVLAGLSVTQCITTQINYPEISHCIALQISSTQSCATRNTHNTLTHSFSFHSSLHTHRIITSLNITLSFCVSSFYNMAAAVTAAVSFPASKSTSLPTRTSVTAPDRILFKKVPSIHMYSTKRLQF